MPKTAAMSLEESHPDLAAQWHPNKNGTRTPADVSAGMTLKVWWLAHGHEWDARVQHRAKSGSGCPYCAGTRVLAGFLDRVTGRRAP